MSRQVLAIGVLCLQCCTVYCIFGIGLEECLPSFPLDAQSTVVVTNCTQSSVTVQFNVTLPYSTFVVVDLAYNNTNNENVKATLLGGAYTARYQTRHLTINPPLTNVTEWTLLFCYEDDFQKPYRLKDVTCEIETDTSYNEDYNDGDYWISSTIDLGPVTSSIYPIYTSSWSSSKVFVELTTSLPPFAMATTSLTGIESFSHTIMLQEHIVSHDVTDSTHQPIATVTFNTITTVTSQVTQAIEVNTGGQEFVTVLIVSLCVCITVIVVSFSLAVCIYRITRKSRELTTPTTDDRSQEFSVDKVYQLPVCITPSPSIITTMSPLLWELDIPTVNPTLERHPSIITHDDLTLDIAALFNSDSNNVREPHIRDITVHGKDKSSSTIISESSDSSNNTVNMASLESDADDSVSCGTGSSYGLRVDNPPRLKSCSTAPPFCYDEKGLGTGTDVSGCSAALSDMECTSETQYYVLKSRTNEGVTLLSTDITDSSNNSTDDSNNVYIVFNS